MLEYQERDGKTTSTNSPERKERKKTRGNHLKNNDTWLQKKSLQHSSVVPQQLHPPRHRRCTTLRTETQPRRIDGCQVLRSTTIWELHFEAEHSFFNVSRMKWDESFPSPLRPRRRGGLHCLVELSEDSTKRKGRSSRSSREQLQKRPNNRE